MVEKLKPKHVEVAPRRLHPLTRNPILTEPQREGRT
jgi:hypothetical protein